MGEDAILDEDVVMDEEVSLEEEVEVSKTADSAAQLTEKQRKEIRDSLDRDIEAFLSRGGQVQQIADNVRADPPRKPNINYGAAPI